MNEWLNDTASWGAVVGIVLPYLVALVNQPRWSGNTKRYVAIAAAVLAGVLTCLANGQIADGKTLFATIALIAVTSQGLYGTLLKPSAKALEGATSKQDVDLAA